MSEPCCNFSKEVAKPGGGYITLGCDRKAYKNNMCVLHLDKNVENEKSEEVREQVARDFQKALQDEIGLAQTASPDYELNWSGAHFPATTFVDCTFPRRVLLTAASFEHGTSFTGCRFSGGLYVSNSRFLGTRQTFNFRNCHFSGEVNFRSVRLGINPVLTECTFDSGVGFDSCEIDTPYFGDNKFRGDVQFAKSKFLGLCDFKSCEFGKTAGYLSIQTTESVVFDFRRSQLSGNLSFGAAEDQLDDMGGQAMLQIAELDFSDVISASKSNLLFQYFASGKTSFRELRLSEGVTLKFKDVDFGYGDYSNIPQQEKAVVSFLNVHLGNTTFLNTNIEKFYFNNITWCPVEYLLGMVRSPDCPAEKPKSREEISTWIRNVTADKESKNHQSSLRQGLVSEVFLQAEIHKNVVARNRQSGKECPLGKEARDQLLREVDRNSENYRQLVKNSDAKRDYTSAEIFHIGEMEMQRQKGIINAITHVGLRRKLSSWNGFSIYKFISKYGTSYHHSLSVLLGIICLMAFMFSLSGLSRLKCNETEPLRAGELAQTNECRLEIYLIPAPDRQFVAKQFVHDYGSAILFTLGVATLQKNTLYETTTPSGEFLRILTVLLMTGQTAVTLFAVRRQFRRGGGE